MIKTINDPGLIMINLSWMLRVIKMNMTMQVKFGFILFNDGTKNFKAAMGTF